MANHRSPVTVVSRTTEIASDSTWIVFPAIFVVTLVIVQRLPTQSGSRPSSSVRSAGSLLRDEDISAKRARRARRFTAFPVVQGVQCKARPHKPASKRRRCVASGGPSRASFGPARIRARGRDLARARTRALGSARLRPQPRAPSSAVAWLGTHPRAPSCPLVLRVGDQNKSRQFVTQGGNGFRKTDGKRMGCLATAKHPKESTRGVF